MVEKIVGVDGGSESAITGETGESAFGILLGTTTGAVGEEVGEEGAEVMIEEGVEGEDGGDSDIESPEVLGAKDKSQKGASWILPIALVAIIGFFVVKSNRGKSKSK